MTSDPDAIDTTLGTYDGGEDEDPDQEVEGHEEVLGVLYWLRGLP